MSEIEKIQRYVGRSKAFPKGTPYQMNLLEAFSLSLGYFPDKEDAIAARQAAEIKYFGEYRRKEHTN